MGEVIDPTLVVWWLREPEPDKRIGERLARVSGWYGEISHEPLAEERWSGGRLGLAALCDPGIGTAWPRWAEVGDLTMASAYVPVGWERITGIEDPAEAAPALARELAAHPERAAEELNAPAVIALADRRRETIELMNDRLGAGRLFELEFSGGRVWSNRVGALPLFSGVAASASRDGWGMFAAGGWFMGGSTGIEGVAKLAPATVVSISRDGVRARSTGALERLLGDERRAPEEQFEAFAAQAQDTVRAADRLYPNPPSVDLSGGRDSRVSAAAAVAAGVPARFRTSDVYTGEADVARELVAALPIEVDHEVTYQGETRKVRRTGLRERAGRLLMLHDGMRNAARVRGGLRLPPPVEENATLSGHGGEIGHGYYYAGARSLRAVNRGGRDAAVKRLLRKITRRHRAARGHAYACTEEWFNELLASGEEAGLEGADLLDFAYVRDRNPNRTGLAAHARRVSVFATPAFIGAVFALDPAERLEARVNREVVARLVPQWRDVPFFKAERAGGSRKTTRQRIWEGEDGEALGEMVRGEGAWTEVFDRDLVFEMWERARAGEATAADEQTFERLTLREVFEEHLARLNARTS